MGLQATFKRREYNDHQSALLFSNDPLFHHPKHVISGGRFMFHNSDELPFKSSQVYFVPYWNVSNFFVTPVITRIDDSLISFTPEEYRAWDIFRSCLLIANISDETVIFLVRNVWNSSKLTLETTVSTNICRTTHCHNVAAFSFGWLV